MRDFIIATESNADLTPEYIAANQILVIPHYYTIDDVEYGDGKEMTMKDFYGALREKKKAFTGASNPAVILERFGKILEEGKDILFISFSSALSGGIHNIRSGAAQLLADYPDAQIEVVDSLSASLGEMLLIEKAVQLKKEGKTLEETKAFVEEMVPHVSVQFTVDDLYHLMRGGRVSAATAVVGSLASIKPILYIDDAGKLISIGKARGRKKSMQTLVDNMKERLGSYADPAKQIFIGIIHGDCLEDAKALEALVQAEGFSNTYVQEIGPSIGVHSGPGALALVFLGEQR